MVRSQCRAHFFRYTVFGALVIAAGFMDADLARASCTTTPIPGGEQVDCTAAPPNPTAGPIATGAGNDTFTISGGTINGDVNQNGGADRVTMSGGTIIGNIDQAGGVDVFIMTGGLIDGNVEQSGDFDTFIMSGGTITGAFVEGDLITITGGSIGSVNMNVGNNVFTMSGGTIVTNVIGFGNNDTFNLSGTAFIGGNVNLGNGQNVFNITGGQIVGTVSSGTGVDRFTWDGGGTIGGAVTLGGGNDIGVLRNLTNANLTMPLLDGGTGVDSLTFDNTIATGVSRFQNWETIDLTNATQLVMDGDLVLGDAGTMTGALSVDGSSILFAGGANRAVVASDGVSPVAVTNAGVIDLSNGGSGAGDTFTVFGNYVGAGGSLRLETFLGTDGSLSDRIAISGAGNSASGSTGLSVINAGGPGAVTVADGILVVQAINGASTAADSFFLNTPVAAGAREYLLFKGGVSGANPDNWYLRSVIEADADQPVPPQPLPSSLGSQSIQIIRPEVAAHSIVPAMARSLDLLALGTFHQRQGDQRLSRDGQPHAAWGRIYGQHTSQDFGGGVLSRFDGLLGGLQAGTDLGRFDWVGGHRSRFGLYVGHAEAAGDVRGAVLGMIDTSAGDLKLGATSAGAYWTHIGPTNWYVDALMQGSFISGDAKSDRGFDGHVRGNGFAASLEGGYPFALTPWLRFEPQAQAIWQHASLDDAHDGLSTITYEDTSVFVGRVGARLLGTMQTTATSWHPYLKANLWWASGGNDKVTFGTDTIFTERNSGVTGEVGVGISGHITPSMSAYGDLGYRAALEGEAHETIQGNIGVRITW